MLPGQAVEGGRLRWLPQDIQISVAGSLGVLEVLAQLPDGIGIPARFVVVVRVTQIADQQMQFRAGHPDPADCLTLRPTAKCCLQTPRDVTILQDQIAMLHRQLDPVFQIGHHATLASRRRTRRC